MITFKIELLEEISLLTKEKLALIVSLYRLLKVLEIQDLQDQVLQVHQEVQQLKEYLNKQEHLNPHHQSLDKVLLHQQ